MTYMTCIRRLPDYNDGSTRRPKNDLHVIHKMWLPLTFIDLLWLVETSLVVIYGTVKQAHHLEHHKGGRPYRPPPPHYKTRQMYYYLLPIVPRSHYSTTFQPFFTTNEIHSPRCNARSKVEVSRKTLPFTYSSISYHHSNVPFSNSTSLPSPFTLPSSFFTGFVRRRGLCGMWGGGCHACDTCALSRCLTGRHLMYLVVSLGNRRTDSFDFFSTCTHVLLENVILSSSLSNWSGRGG